MMLLRVYFAFDYGRDLYRVSKIYKLPNVLSRAAAGFQDSTVWKEASRRGDAEVRGLIDDALRGTSVTVVCIGFRTAHGKHLRYQIERSLEQGNALLGIKINHLPDQDRIVDKLVPVPPVIEESGYKVHSYTGPSELVGHIKEAEELAKQRS